ncbi:hypothetical protein DUI87_17568 [Hirundo rustica rustica]|uniref:Solute carrier family 2, facilitated glucose transporter member 5 n=1 Tax=Hirundo rustica rustica TaxID=333673 RepID=A0A3M0JYL8_HIRRU|nr:hypothetical protein DUI87_17568 [Hirundo rustica rustica]
MGQENSPRQALLQNKILILTICAAGIGGTFQYGYNISIINAPASYIQMFMNTTWLERMGVPLESNVILLLWSFTVSAYPLGGLAGAVAAGPMAIMLGRKMSLLLNNVFVIIAATLSGFSRMAKSFEMIMLSRFFTGVNAGVSMNIQPMYLAESAPKKLRGAVALTSASFTALGLVLGQVVGLRELLGGEESWPFLLASNVIPALIQLTALPWFPESPRYLLIDRGDKESCISALQKLRGTSDLSAELEEMLAEQAAVKGQRAKNPWELFQNPALRWQVLSIVVLSSAMQLCGNDSNMIIDYAGRRPLLLGGYIFMAGWAIVFMVALSQQTQISWMPYLSMACIFAYILSFGIGPAGVTGVLPTEVFDQMSRPAAYMICGSLLWFNLFLVGTAFPFIVSPARTEAICTRQSETGLVRNETYLLDFLTFGASPYIQSFIRETWLKRYGSSPSAEMITLMWSFIVSIYSIGGLLGSSSAGYLSVRFGRKKAMLLANIPALLGAALMGLSQLCGSFEMIIAGRLFSGACGGLAQNVHIMYAGECAPRNLRGLIAITASTSIATGKFVGFALGLREVLGVEALWPILLAANAVPVLVQLLTLPFFPDSPRYLLIDQKDKEGCIKAVKQLWGDGDHMAEVDDMMSEQKAIRGEKAKSVWDLLRDRAVRWQLISLFLVISCMQLIGVNVVYFYAYSIFTKAGIPPAQIHYVSLGVGTTEILSTVLCGFLIERAGRKALLWKSYTVMALALGLLTLTLSLQDSFFWVPYCSVALVFILVMSFGIGPGGVACPLITEIFIQSYRPAAYVFNGITNWIQLFILGLVFPFIVEGLGNFCFIIFLTYCLSMAIFVFLVLPETKGKTMLQVMEEFHHLNYHGKKGQAALQQSNCSVVRYRRLLLMIVVLGIGGTHLSGFQMSVINYTSPYIQKFINDTWLERYGSVLPQETLMLLWSFIVSVYCMGGMIGCLCSGYLAAKFGKKKCLLLNDVVLIAATLHMGFSRRAKSFEMILAGRFLEGIAAANLTESIIPYVSLGVSISELISIILCDQFLWLRYCSVILIFLFIIAYGIGPGEYHNKSNRKAWTAGISTGHECTEVELECVQYQGLFRMIIVLGIGGTFQIGFQISTITYMSQHVKAFINETWLERYGYPIQQDNLLFLWSITVSIFGIGGLLGSSGSRYLTVKFGKKKCLLCTNVLMLLAASIMGCSKISQSFEMILIGRFMCGVSAGLCVPLHHQYVGEISPRKLRGFANSTSSFFWSLGKAIGQISGQRELLGSQSLWPVLMASCGVPALVQLVTLPFFPESPPYLLMHKGDQEGCKKAIRQLWGEGQHQAEIDDIMKEKATMKNTKILSVLELVKEPAFRWQLYMIVILTATIQLCGINAIYFYTFEVLQAAGFDEKMASYMTLSIGLSELVAAVVCVSHITRGVGHTLLSSTDTEVISVLQSSIIERLGRKTLLRGGYWTMGSLLAAITVTLSLQDWYFWMPYCSLGLIILFTVVFALGPAGASVSTRVEIFKLSCRPPAFVISAVLNWLGVFVVGTSFPFIVVQFRGLLQMILVLGIGGSFPYGFHISVINYPSVHIRKFINETWIDRHGSPLHPETIMLLWSFIVSVYGIGGFLGSLCCGYLTTKYRKKKCQMFTNLIMLVAALFMALSKTAKSFEMVLVGRFLYGIGSAIRKLWGEGDHQAEIDDIMKEKGAMASTKTLRVLEVIKERSLRWQLYILMTVMTTLQLCGINAVECSLYPQDKRQH